MGAAERHALLKIGDVSSGDIVLALPSSGIHSNGFSLVRKIIEVTGADIHKPFALAPHISLGEALLTRHGYADAVKAGLNAGGSTSISHITGGGLIENPPQVFGDDLAITLDMALRPFPFVQMAETGWQSV